MPRVVELGDESISIHLSGLTSVAALKKEVEVPYLCIAKVEIGPPNRQEVIRLGGTSIGDIQEGHFWHGEDWYFLSYEHFDQVVTLTLKNFHIGHRKYKVVAFGTDDPEQMKAQIEAKMVSSLD